ncbi:MAG: DUF2784 family protein [Chitinophagaceae bacterium]|nr:MAG: DUF2784 family protein [Chitinophagaceae bacterium]
MEAYYPVLDYFFLIFHFILILFNLFAWIWKPLRKAHLIVLGLTFASWFILGIWYGWGYCPLTDWHWTILREMGEVGLPGSYVTYLIDRLIGIRLSDTLTEVLTIGLAFIALIISIKVNFFHSK